VALVPKFAAGLLKKMATDKRLRQRLRGDCFFRAAQCAGKSWVVTAPWARVNGHGDAMCLTATSDRYMVFFPHCGLTHPRVCKYWPYLIRALTPPDDRGASCGGMIGIETVPSGARVRDVNQPEDARMPPSLHHSLQPRLQRHLDQAMTERVTR